MQNFIVLGIVPGTNFQLTFTSVVFAATTLICLPFARYAWHRRFSLRNYIAARLIAHTIDQYQLQA